MHVNDGERAAARQRRFLPLVSGVAASCVEGHARQGGADHAHAGERTPEQRDRWLPGIAGGELITAVAMTEPGTGSDLAAIATRAPRDGDHYVVDGAKTFITNGINADLVITAVKTDPSERHRGISLVVIERGMEGFERGRNLEKVGMHSQDTAELFFSGVRVPVENRLGDEGRGFGYLMSNLAQERLSIAVAGVSSAAAALEWTIEYVRERTAFGNPLGALQATRFTLAEIKTDVEVAQAFVDQCVTEHVAGRLTPERAAMAKLHATELQGRVLDRCVQLFGGYGYMLEYPIARAYADARVTRIYEGANEIQMLVIARQMVAEAEERGGGWEEAVAAEGRTEPATAEAVGARA